MAHLNNLGFKIKGSGQVAMILENNNADELVATTLQVGCFGIHITSLHITTHKSYIAAFGRL